MRKIVFLLVLTVVFGLNIAAVSAYSEDEFSSIQTRQAGGLYTCLLYTSRRLLSSSRCSLFGPRDRRGVLWLLPV